MLNTPLKHHIIEAMLNPPECGMRPMSRIDVGVAEYKALTGGFGKATDAEIREYVIGILGEHIDNMRAKGDFSLTM